MTRISQVVFKVPIRLSDGGWNFVYWTQAWGDHVGARTTYTIMDRDGMMALGLRFIR